MLTLNETIAAIKALETEADVITNACKQVINPKAGKPQSVEEVSVTVADLLMDKLKPSEGIEALCLIMASMIVTIAKPGKEQQLIESVFTYITHSYKEMKMAQLMNQLEKDPAKAIDSLTAMLKGLR